LAGDDGMPLARGEPRIPFDDVRPDVADGSHNHERGSKLNHGAEVHQFDRLED